MCFHLWEASGWLLPLSTCEGTGRAARGAAHVGTSSWPLERTKLSRLRWSNRVGYVELGELQRQNECYCKVVNAMCVWGVFELRRALPCGLWKKLPPEVRKCGQGKTLIWVYPFECVLYANTMAAPQGRIKSCWKKKRCIVPGSAHLGIHRGCTIFCFVLSTRLAICPSIYSFAYLFFYQFRPSHAACITEEPQQGSGPRWRHLSARHFR